jgi:predicted RNase H-like HicB family nuclease
MKKVKEIIFIVSESEEGGYEAKALDFPIFTQGESIEELKEMIKDAVKCHFEENKVPEIINLHIVKDEVLTL